ncbi:lipid-A-disaccharide synthase [Olivibacter sp. XZL3]|uniref:lipid-A-disaccharide synthase n=1 Tax=Olivibacter sp. XZL3 TaxID=1735116 RepID=UPI001064F0FA|nr:lipid-A-disaccharide synthase [Olivibacter sp. XZL3]
MKYYVIAGESSGDLHGARLIEELRKRQGADAQFRIVGGDRMEQACGERAMLHVRDMSFMGFIEVLLNIKSIAKNLRTVKEDLLAYRPDVLILIDFPGFNLKIASFAKHHDIKVFYYISPKVWAWNTGRVKTIKRIVDHLFCILPFEVDFYKQWDMKVDYVGNPLLDAVALHHSDSTFKIRHGLEGKKLIALLPGSRKMEISKLLPEMVKLVNLFPGHQMVIAGAPNFDKGYYDAYIGGHDLPVIFDETYNLLQHSEAAVVASGTATLETALLDIPQVVVYKANPISIAIGRRVIKVKYISLVNLIMDEEVVKELIQEDANYRYIANELNLLLNDGTHRLKMLAAYKRLRDVMGKPGASKKVAELIERYLAK